MKTLADPEIAFLHPAEEKSKTTPGQLSYGSAQKLMQK
jgi:hypothetical protein